MMDISDQRQFDPDLLAFLNSEADPANSQESGTSRKQPLTETANEVRVVSVSDQDTKFCGNDVSTTKYSLITFLPKFLFEQLRRYSNRFFVCVSVLQQIPGVSPTGKYTTLGPLTAIWTFSAVKEIIEDLKRARDDKIMNNQKCQVFADVEWVARRWKEVKVGDIVKIENNEIIPADLVMLSSSEAKGMSYIETASLDGETNLKIREALPQTSHLTTENQLRNLKCTIKCATPNPDLYRFSGTLELTGEAVHAIGPEQFLLRGAVLKNTQWIYAVVVYTGRESKIRLNAVKAPLKKSSLENQVNKQILFLFVILLVIAAACTVATYLVNSNGLANNHWYLSLDTLSSANYVLDFFTFCILFHNIIPISLQVSLEIIRIFQAKFIEWDLEIYCEKTDTPAIARTSNLNEELGQIKYIFSDKTGTLTQNVMVLKKCTIGGAVYGNVTQTSAGSREMFYDAKLVEKLRDGDDGVWRFCMLMTVCHTVVPKKEDEGVGIKDSSYLASSPDELALVLGAKDLGFVFTARTAEKVTIETLGREAEYEVLHFLEFTSNRKRMSVIVRDKSRKLLLLVKGADTVILSRLSSNNKHQNITIKHLDEFACLGLRTLCLAYVEISEGLYQQWKPYYVKAATAIYNREEKLEAAAELIEKDLILLGATAIEDKLQDGVPETIASLAQAGIKIWIITGDKKETAINIGFSCKHLTNEMHLMCLTDKQSEEDVLKTIDEFMEQLKACKDRRGALVADSTSLVYALSGNCETYFLNLALKCESVICCRVSPKQKASLVRLVRNNLNEITLAIGDGGNDVSMIQAAHVGVGISGVEGLQAANSSDYAIAQFRFLKRLLFVHGALSYNRLSKAILYFFYKNICLWLISLWFIYYNGVSGQLMFERWSVAMFNVLFSLWPPIAVGMFDTHCSIPSLMKLPKLYLWPQNSKFFNIRLFWFWTLNGVFHSFMLFTLPALALHHDIAFSDGKTGGHFFLGNLIFSCVVLVISFKLYLEAYTWNWLVHIAILNSILNWFLYLGVYPYIWEHLPSGMSVGASMVGMNVQVYSCFIFWLGIFLIPLATLLPDIVYKVLDRMFNSSDYLYTIQLLENSRKNGKLEAYLRETAGGLSGDPESSDHVTGDDAIAQPGIVANNSAHMGQTDGHLQADVEETSKYVLEQEKVADMTHTTQTGTSHMTSSDMSHMTQNGIATNYSGTDNSAYVGQSGGSLHEDMNKTDKKVLNELTNTEATTQYVEDMDSSA